MTALSPATQDETRNQFAPHPTVLAVELRHLENLPQPIHFNDKIVARIASLIRAFEASDSDEKGDRKLKGQQALCSDAWSSLSAWAVQFGHGRTSDLTPTFPRAVHDRLGELKGRL